MKYITILALLTLTACATPVTTLKKGDQTVTCGGSYNGAVLGGAIGYHIEKGMDQECVNKYLQEGYSVQ